MYIGGDVISNGVSPKTNRKLTQLILWGNLKNAMDRAFWPELFPEKSILKYYYV